MNVGTWIRVSTSMQAEGDSPDLHRSIASEYCTRNKLTPVTEYDLTGFSGKDVLSHPEANRMLADVASGKIKALVFTKFARLSRSTKQTIEIAEYFKKHNARLMSVQEGVDTSTAIGAFYLRIIASVGEWEREEIASRVAASVPYRAKKGTRIGGQQPYGYHWLTKEQLVPHPEQSLVAKKAFELFAQHKKIKLVCSMLNDLGYRAAKSPWCAQTLKRLLVNEVYIGRYLRNYSKSKGDKKSWVLKPESDWVIIDVEPIVSQELWDEVQNVFAIRPQIYQKGIAKEGSYLYSGTLICECGKKMYVTPYKNMSVPKYVCATCRNTIWEDGLTQNFIMALNQIVIQPSLLESPNENEELLNKAKYELEMAQREEIRVRGQLDRLFEIYTDGTIKKDAFAKRHDPLVSRQNQLLDTILTLEQELSKATLAESGRQYLTTQAQSLAELWDTLSLDERRKITRELIKEIKVGLVRDSKQEIEFVFTFLPEIMDNLPHLDKEVENGVRRGRGSWQLPA